jgi:cytochrome oxidase Cu insertion factor (SCO1/SenC/PrrC family)
MNQPTRPSLRLTPFRALWMGMAWGGLLVGVLFLVLLGQSHSGHPVTHARMAEPAFHLENQLGQPVSSLSFPGRIEIVSFISPYCRQACPLVAHHYVEYAQAIREAGWSRKVVLLSFNLDPRRASPETLRKFQRAFGWNPRNLAWEFLTGSPRAIDQVVKGGFKVWFGFEPASTPGGPSGSPPALIIENPLNPTGAIPDPAHEDPLEIYGPGHHLRKLYQSGSLVSTGRLMKTLFGLIPHGAAPKRA